MSTIRIQPWRLAMVASGSVAIPAGAVLAINHALAPSRQQLRPPTFEDLPALPNTPSTNIMMFHGLWDGPGRYGELVPYLQGHGRVTLAMNGAQVDNTAPAAFSHLQSRGTHSQMVVGFSLGSQTVMQYLLTHLAATGRPVESAIIVSGMAHPRYVKWPHWALPIACEILHHGPIVDYFWEYHWSQRIRGTKSSKSELLRQRQQFGSCTALTGARRLRRGVRGLKPGIFNGTRMLIVEHTADRWVTGCFPAWKHLCNQAEHLVINGPGHADFTEYIGEYTQGINSWLHATA